jgi:hypothetical protein
MTLEAVAMPDPAEADRGELAKFAYALPTATAVRDGALRVISVDSS